ncbi:DUF4365 domain-containing protein [Vibrio parahaemolyticus]|uniref:DUF4365 domain-containing protein n=1 Tax=Vibrio parahaemolyticus TaxID=670 RepID=UPI0011100F12|nr:DUF4365 domain-containing protein [Vibrio parahaemolyticus]MBE4384984.1 DUF4365 domain-containing protein [Vibrio parahaemolyticus]MEA5230249.1 DUF4365 domain-containing protein [Vibrio parahaemolyticus]TMX39624.1 hypothetical protein DA098_10070 [Vibrio parahaemolyticus]TMX80309.1 hypothetical protein DA094_01905 [Vibrio parahaemolyticus]
MYEDEDLGRIGETLVDAAAAQESITCSPPALDRYGWDLILEFHNKGSALLLDASDSMYTVYAQVKAFKSCYDNYPGRAIKLSNLHHMITSPNPCFIFFVDANTKNFYVVHLWEELIYEGLKSIRQAEKDCVPLHKRSLTINPRTRNALKIENCNGDYNLKDKLLSQIALQPSCYSKRKLEIRQAVGYENGNVKIIANLEKKEFAKLELGLIDSLELNVENFFDNRFNIPLVPTKIPEKIELLSDDYSVELGLAKQPTGDTCECVVFDDNNQEISLSGVLKAYKSEKYLIFSHRYFKFWIDNTASVNNVAGDFLIGKLEGDKLSIDEIERVLKFAFVIFDPSPKTYDFHTDSNTYSFQVDCKEKHNSDGLKGFKLEKILGFIPNLKWLFQLLQIDVATKVTLYDLGRLESSLSILMNQLNNTEKSVARISLPEGCDSIESEKVHYCYIPLSLPLFNEIYIILIEAQGTIDTFDGNTMYSTSMQMKTPLIRKIRRKADVKRFAISAKNLMDVAKSKGRMILSYQSLSEEHIQVFRKVLKN